MQFVFRRKTIYTKGKRETKFSKQKSELVWTSNNKRNFYAISIKKNIFNATRMHAIPNHPTMHHVLATSIWITLGAADEFLIKERKLPGFTWNYAKITLHLTVLLAWLEPTKQDIVRLSAKLGFMSAVTILFKILFHELCGRKMFEMTKSLKSS